jgi:hypothetical protein
MLTPCTPYQLSVSGSRAAGVLAGSELRGSPGQDGERECGEGMPGVVVARFGLVTGQEGGQLAGGSGQVKDPEGSEDHAEGDQPRR